MESLASALHWCSRIYAWGNLGVNERKRFRVDVPHKPNPFGSTSLCHNFRTKLEFENLQ